MAFRQFLKGQVEWDRLEGVLVEFTRRYDRPSVRVEFLDADNWLSVPCVVDDRWFVKVITPQHSLLHAVLTTGRNLGAFSSGQEGFFEHVADPIEMAERELEATRRMRDLGLDVPEPVEAFEHDGLGVLVVEYLPSFRTLTELTPDEVLTYAPDLFGALARMHAAGLSHGDLRAENVLVARDRLYLIDATSVREGAIEQARAYDLACALAALEPLVGPRATLDAALAHYPTRDLLAAEDFLDFVNIRPDHDFDAATVKGEIEKQASAEGVEG
ncbi:RIO1 family regulatory kinase/ATPase domain-containing protein [Halomarina oriensis]|uniref:non-specific serine/threonine protein kinase n=1 Tax=Halomarina oriensis TaxID=671145 RepID=A0A6B0GKH8_9EURY|nr:RIO1 family regulatory kinase/ATPase [Halomarina oriensis]MWG33293.1 protein kinase family protein [Halomarina oriensis]